MEALPKDLDLALQLCIDHKLSIQTVVTSFSKSGTTKASRLTLFEIDLPMTKIMSLIICNFCCCTVPKVANIAYPYPQSMQVFPICLFESLVDLALSVQNLFPLSFRHSLDLLSCLLHKGVSPALSMQVSRSSLKPPFSTCPFTLSPSRHPLTKHYCWTYFHNHCPAGCQTYQHYHTPGRRPFLTSTTASPHITPPYQELCSPTALTWDLAVASS